MTVIAVTGHKGTIGSQLVKKGYTPLECDITNIEQTFDTVSSVNPDVIIHCAAMTSVEWCENNEKEASKVNIRGTAHVLDAFAGRFIYLSTVHVFNGEKYWDYSEKHRPDPLNVYGFTKFAGEAVARTGGNPYTIIRISRSFNYKSLANTLGYLDDTDDTVEFPTFIKRSFALDEHLADGIAYVAENNIDEKILNVSGTDTLSYYHFWVHVAKVFGVDENRIIDRKHEIKDYPRPFRGGLSVRKAKRLGVPLYSAMDGIKLIKESM